MSFDDIMSNNKDLPLNRFYSDPSTLYINKEIRSTFNILKANGSNLM